MQALFLGWVRAARETKGGITFREYKELSIKQRAHLHHAIDTILEMVQEQYDTATRKHGS